MIEYDYSNFAAMISTMSLHALMDMHYDYGKYIFLEKKDSKLNMERIKMKFEMLEDQITEQIPICFLMNLEELKKLV